MGESYHVVEGDAVEGEQRDAVVWGAGAEEPQSEELATFLGERSL